jgi:hypothetical protein
VFNAAKAREILKDKRVPPKQTVFETIALPQEDLKGGHIKVSLLYRSASQKMLDTITGKGQHPLPIVTMAEIQSKI